MKKIIYAILICIILVGGIMIGSKGFNVDAVYSKSIKMELYLGKEFDNQEVKQIVQEVFGTSSVLIQKVELFEDMVAITIREKDIENLDEKLESLNTKINEKYELQNKVEEITVVHQPKVRLSSIVKPYILPCSISGVIILAYSMIRFRNLGVWKIVAKYVINTAMIEATYFSLIAITRVPFNRLILPIGLVIYVATITAVTIAQEKKLAVWQFEQTQKK
ncbi:MAG: hypothetical protein IJ777_03150 [Clostridia bacterium]|nr:hypothetical protein [Clostridia bacterium]